MIKRKSERKNHTIKIDPLLKNGLELIAIKQDRPKSYCLNWALRTGHKVESLTDEQLVKRIDELAVQTVNSAMEVPVR